MFTATPLPLPRILLAVALAAASLWDFRVYDVRIFDAVALAIVGVYLLTTREPLTAWIERRGSVLLLFAVIAAYAIYGFALHTHTSSLAILAFTLIALQLSGQHDFPELAQTFKWLIISHCAAFMIQFAFYYIDSSALHSNLDYRKLLIGEPSRFINTYPHGRPYLRATGLFSEPNNYCLNMYFLIAGYLMTRRFSRLLILAAAFTMMLSASLWGIAAALAAVCLMYVQTEGTWKRRIMSAGLTCLGLFIAFNGTLWISKPSEERVPQLYVRILNIAVDTSVRDRYIERPIIEEKGAPPCPDCAAASPPSAKLPAALSLIAGEGLTTKHFLRNLPNNGFHFLLKSFGLAGLSLLGLGMWLALRQSSVTAKLFTFGALGISLSTYPIVTCILFWLWFPLLLVTSRSSATVAPGAPREAGA